MKIKINRIIAYSLVVIVSIFACFCITSKKATKLNDKVKVYAAPSDLVTIQFKDINMYNAVKQKVGTSKINSSDNTNMTLIMTEENISSITSLNLYYRNIKDISGIEKFINLTNLSMDYNQITDISALSSLTNLSDLDLSNNQISDISSIINLDIFKNGEVYFYGNNSTGTVSGKVYKIPSIITLRDKEFFIKNCSSKDLKLVNCTLSEDSESIILNPGLKKGDTVIIKFEDFAISHGMSVSGLSHTLTVDDVYINPPIPTITYSKTEQTNENVTATISFNKEGVTILNNDGKNTCTFEENGEFTFEYIDENGNTGNAKAIVNNIDKEMPVGNITYETTNEGVVATINFNKEGITILNNDGKNTYTFKENGEFTFEFVDMAGNKGSVKATVNNIVKNTENSNNNKNANTGDNIVTLSVILVVAVLCVIVTKNYIRKNSKIKE